MKTVTCFLSGLAAVVLIATMSSGRNKSATREEFRFNAAKLKDRGSWTQVNSEPYYVSSELAFLCRAPTAADYASERKKNPHAATFITVYVNKVGRKAMFSNESRRFPEGSVIVKQKMGQDSEGVRPLLYTVMTKRERGYNPSVGDWEFSVIAGNGTQLEASGKLENCQACHINKPESDFVFRPYLKSQ
jgi:hypothetical protein